MNGFSTICEPFVNASRKFSQSLQPSQLIWRSQEGRNAREPWVDMFDNPRFYKVRRSMDNKASFGAGQVSWTSRKQCSGREPADNVVLPVVNHIRDSSANP